MNFRTAGFSLGLLLACSDSPSQRTVAPGPDDPPGQGVLFRANWNTATGSGADAVTDGGRFDESYCNHPQVLSVVPGSAVGWDATANVLQVTNRGEQYCWQIETTNSIPPGQSFYIRMYIRVEDEDQMNFHPVSLNVLGDIQMAPWSIQNPTATGYLPGVRLIKQSYANATWVRRPALSRRTWYRFEYHVEIVNQSQRTFRVWPRIYDMNGTLLADASQFTHIDGGSRTLKQFYDGGGTSPFTNANMLRRFGVGYEGSAGARDSRGRWYYAAIEVRSDTWPGPVQ